MTFLRSEKFLKSALTLENPYQSLDETRSWLETFQKKSAYDVMPIAFKDLQGWSFEEGTQNLRHESGQFFSVEGLRIKTNFLKDESWDQPMVFQREVGILGFITRVVGGVRYFLVQAKMEPGYINHVQLVPTLQATRSNFTQVHQGKSPKYLEYFLNPEKGRILLDQLHSEQGTRFFGKRNRNIIIEIDEDVEVYEEFHWLTLGEIKKLLLDDDLVNMCSRIVLSMIPFGAMTPEDEEGQCSSPFAQDLLTSYGCCPSFENSLQPTLTWLADQKLKVDCRRELIPLGEVQKWKIGSHDISHESGDFFSVIALAVEAKSREVATWSQPILKHHDLGLIGCLCQKQEGTLRFLIQAKFEPGLMDVLELAPTVAAHGLERRKAQLKQIPFFQQVHEAPASQVRYESIQSEEGGRFYHLRNKMKVVEIPENQKLDIPDHFRWMTLGELSFLIRFNNFLNIELRSLLACLNFF